MLNYAPKALASLAALRPFIAEHLPMNLPVHDWCAAAMERAVMFHLPDDGLVFGENAQISYPDLMRGQHRLPFASTGIEFALNKGTYPIMEGAVHPTLRRLTLAVDLKDARERKFAKQAFGAFLDFAMERIQLDPESPAACLMMSLDYSALSEPYLERIRGLLTPVGEAWLPSWAAILLPYDQTLRDVEPRLIEEGVLAEGRLSRKATIAMEPVPYGQTGLMKIEEVGGQMHRLQTMLGEFVLESGTTLSMMIALSCKNIRAVVNEPSEKLQRSRLRRGQRPLFSYRTLVVEVSERARGARGELASGVRSSPYEHLRRGHVRRLPNGDQTWVSHALVNPGSPGRIQKDYHLRAQG